MNSHLSRFLCFSLMLSLSFLTSGFALAQSGKGVKRLPSAEVSSCVNFAGDAAKKTFIALYPLALVKGTVVSKESNKFGTRLSTSNITCLVNETFLSTDLNLANKTLIGMDSAEYQCGYAIVQNGSLSACSDPN